MDKNNSAREEYYFEKFFKASKSGSVKYKFIRALEKAKRLSINIAFQEAVDAFRIRWKIKASLPLDNFQASLLFPDSILYNYAFQKELSEKEWQDINEDLELTLCLPFGLDKTYDFGLVVASICFGLTPENIINNWNKIELTSAKSQPSGVKIIVRNQTEELLEKLGYMATVVYLASRLKSLRTNISTLPQSVSQYIKKSIEGIGYGNLSNQLDLEKVIRFANQGRIDKVSSNDLELFLKIEPETTKEDLLRTWPQIELRKIKLWGETPKKLRIWRTYERDVFIWRKVMLEKLTYEKAYNEWLDKQPYDTVKDITAVIKAVKRLDKLAKAKNI